MFFLACIAPSPTTAFSSSASASSPAWTPTGKPCSPPKPSGTDPSPLLAKTQRETSRGPSRKRCPTPLHFGDAGYAQSAPFSRTARLAASPVPTPYPLRSAWSRRNRTSEPPNLRSARALPSRHPRTGSAPRFGTPTTPQRLGWPRHRARRKHPHPRAHRHRQNPHCLSLVPRSPHVLAPPSSRRPNPGCRVLYISPLKALAVDVERNLRTPLDRHRPPRSRRWRPLPSPRDRHPHRRYPAVRTRPLPPPSRRHPHHHP